MVYNDNGKSLWFTHGTLWREYFNFQRFRFGLSSSVSHILKRGVRSMDNGDSDIPFDWHVISGKGGIGLLKPSCT